jgi:D-alanine--poly(phosphoribitol) ligase subunit 1
MTGDRVSQFPSIAFDVSVIEIYGGLGIGATLYPLVGAADRTFPARVVAREKLTVWNSTPSVVSMMMRAGDVTHDRLGSLRLVNLYGEALMPTHLAAIFAAVPDAVALNTYGPTEATVTVTELRVDRTNYAAACAATVSIGAAIPGMGIHLVGGPGPDEGEIVITGPQLALGYWNDPDKTAAAFRTVMVDGAPVRGYFTGDWAERRGEHIFFRERIDLQVKIHGFRLELDEVAHAIHGEGYPVACVLKWNDELAAVIERDPDRPFDEAALRAALAVKLEMHAVPSIIRLIDRMPYNQNDKLDRRAVSEWLSSTEAGADERS